MIPICAVICVGMIYAKRVYQKISDSNSYIVYSHLSSILNICLKLKLQNIHRNYKNHILWEKIHLPAEKLLVFFNICITFFVLVNACWTLSCIFGGKVDFIVELCQFFCLKFSFTVLLSERHYILLRADSLRTFLLF